MAAAEIHYTTRWLADELLRGLSLAMEAMTGELPSIEVSVSSEPPAKQLTWWQQPLSFPADAAVYIGCAEADMLSLGEYILNAAGVDATPDESRGTYSETIQQALSALASSLSSKLRHEVNCLAGKQFPGPSGVEAKIEVRSGPNSEVIWLSFHPSILTALNPDKAQPAMAVTAATGMVAPPAQPPQQTKTLPRTMDLLLDVELPVSISFGRAQLPLKDVIKLTTGSIVELNRSISEPVEVIVNNCVIARGEVVVVEGNYGVRIDQIISRQERLRTLK